MSKKGTNIPAPSLPHSILKELPIPHSYTFALITEHRLTGKMLALHFSTTKILSVPAMYQTALGDTVSTLRELAAYL